MSRLSSKQIFDPISNEFLSEYHLNPDRTKKAILYLRVSTDEQAKRNSTDSQLDVCKIWCERNNVEIAEVFEDVAVSGRNL